METGNNENRLDANKFTPNYKILGDMDLMPYGKYKDMPMKDVPAEYLLFLSDNNKCNKSVRAYVTDNWERLCRAVNRNSHARWWEENGGTNKWISRK